MQVVAGDYFERPIQLTKNGEPFVISEAATVRARLVSLQCAGDVSEEVMLFSGSPGSSWPTSLVMLIFSSAITSTWRAGRAKFEIEVSDPEPRTWFVTDVLVQPQTLT